MLSRIISTFSFYFLLFLLFQNCEVEGKTLRVSTQNDLDELNSTLRSQIQNGYSKINVVFNSGIYFYDNNCLSLENLYVPRLSLSFIGNGVLLIPKGRDYKSGEEFQGDFSTFISVIDINKKRDVPYWENVRHAESSVELVDAPKGLWRIKCSSLNDAAKDECKYTYIILPCWYTSYTLKVDYIENGYLYFVSANKTYLDGYKCYMLDADYGYGHIYPRFKICNYSDAASFSVLGDKQVHLCGSLSKAHVCDACTFINLNNCHIKNLKIKNLVFLGSSAKKQTCYLIEVKNCIANRIQIFDNSFEGMQNTVIGIENTDNIQIENNIIRQCYRSGIFVDNNCSSIEINNNTISYCGLGMKQDLGICVFGGNYHISKNIIYNYGYSAINVGMWHGHENVKPSYGVIEYNEIYQTPSYIKNIDNYGLMDAGAIYLSTQNDGAIIRNNYIHDISGIKDNRGIFCDDGARNFTIEGNIITNILNCFCIDSWRVSVHEDKLGPTNVGNTIRDNILGGTLRFEARENIDNGCELGINYYIKDKSGYYENIYRSIVASGKEKTINVVREENGIYYLDESSFYDFKKHTLFWRYFKKRVYMSQ